MSDTSRLTPKSITGMGPGREPYGVTYTSAHTDHNFYYLRLRKNIILNANGGAFTGSGHDDGDASLSGANSIKTISGVMYGEKVSFYVDNEGNHLSDAKNPVRPGYEFLGWFTDADLTTAYKLAGEGVASGQADMTVPDSDVELWAKWQAASIQVEYYLTAVAGDEAVETQPYGKGDYVVFPGDYVAGTQIDGLGTFRYWAYRSAAGKFIKYNAGSRLDDSLKLYAMWDTDSFRVTYIAPDATAETQKYSPTDDLSYDVTAEANIFAPTGTFVYQDDNGTINNDMIFYGWRDESTGKTYLPGSSMPMSGHKTLVAMVQA